jgi:hypothetical protein
MAKPGDVEQKLWIKTTLRKFDGEYKEGMKAKETVETVSELTADEVKALFADLPKKGHAHGHD